MRRSHELSRNQWLVAVVSAGLAFSMQSMLARGADLPQTVKPASVQRETELAAAYLTGCVLVRKGCRGGRSAGSEADRLLLPGRSWRSGRSCTRGSLVSTGGR
jgi:hypothetical protein